MKLRNGKKIADLAAQVLNVTFQAVLKEDPATARELVMKCRDDAYAITNGTAIETLKDLALLEDNGSVRKDVRNLIQSSAIGEGEDMAFVSPFAVARVFGRNDVTGGAPKTAKRSKAAATYTPEF